MFESTNKTLWHVYDLTRSADSIRGEPGTCHDVGLYLRAELSKLYRTAVEFITERASELWMHVVVESDDASGAPAAEFFLMYHHRAPVVFIASMTAPYFKCVRSLLATACGATDVVPRDLSSRNLRSLCELLLHRDASGAFRRYQSQLEPTPLQRDAVANAGSVARGLERQAKRSRLAAAAEAERKRRVVDGRLPDARPEQRLVEEEDAARRAERESAASAALGDAAHLPQLMTLEIQSHRPYAGSFETRRAPEGLVSVRLRLRGAHVLRGVRALIEDGHVALPLPPLVAKLGRIDSSKLIDGAPANAILDAPPHNE